jgi:3-hydroxyacyl-CoA dehydrogenase
MFYADSVGAAAILSAIRRFADRYGRAYWTPAPLLEKIAASGGKFQDLGGATP